METMEFNLLREPWVRVRTQDCTVQEVSLTDALLHAHAYVDLAGEMPTQDAAMLRLQLAVLHTVFSRTTHSRTPTQRCEDGRYLALERFISRKTHSHPKATLLLKRVSLTMYSLHPVSRCCQDVLSPFRHQTG